MAELQNSFQGVQEYLKDFDEKYSTKTRIVFSNIQATMVQSILPTGAEVTIKSNDVAEAMNILLRICRNF